MGSLTLILAIGLGFGAFIFLLLLLYYLCLPCIPLRYNNHQRNDIVDVENGDNLQISAWKPEIKNIDSVSYIKELKRPPGSLLTKTAIEKHIDPNCKTDLDAIRKSEERDRKYNKTLCNTNHVFQISPSDFREEYLPGKPMQVRNLVFLKITTYHINSHFTVSDKSIKMKHCVILKMFFQ